MKILHVGLGAKGRRWFQAASSLSGARSVGVVDDTPAARKWIQEKSPDVPIYQRLEDALGDVRADMALVASEPSGQVELASQALRAGLGIVIVPPVAAGVDDARQLLRAAEESSAPMITAFSCRQRPAYRLMGALLSRGWIGPVTHASVLSRSPFPADDRVAELDYSQLLAHGTDELEAAGSLLGAKPVSLICRTEKSPWDSYRHGSTTEAFVEFEGQLHLHYHGRLVPNSGEQEIWIEGEKGTFWTDGQRVWWRKRGWPRFLPFPKPRYQSPDLAVLRQAKAAISHRHGQGRLENGLLTSAALVESAIRSDRDRRAVSINELLNSDAALENRTSHPPQGAIS